jgi:hypothetical protein
VDTHPSIKNYVAIDDIPLKSDLGDLHAIETELKLTKEDADKCIELLNG